ncbi:hypothetical protein HMI55_002492 [Coelomomyces lativittatus]|nr:hypothetical protein HMI55_002492 [Coelomomyces lativittatus]
MIKITSPCTLSWGKNVSQFHILPPPKLLSFLFRMNSTLHNNPPSALTQPGYSRHPLTPEPLRFESRPIPAYKLLLAKYLGLLGSSQVQYRSMSLLYNTCVKASFARLPLTLEYLPDTFQTWFSLTQLHVWMVLVRLRVEDLDQKQNIQFLVDHFFKDVERRIWAVGFALNSVVTRHLKECFSMYTGANIAYNASIFHSDTLLACTLWKNLFQGLPVPFESLEVMVHWVRRELNHLEQIPFDKFQKGEFLFAHQLLVLEFIKSNDKSKHINHFKK